MIFATLSKSKWNNVDDLLLLGLSNKIFVFSVNLLLSEFKTFIPQDVL